MVTDRHTEAKRAPVQLADHITCRVLGVDDVIWSVEPRSEFGQRLARSPRCFTAAEHDAWLEQRQLQLQVEAWWTDECADAHAASFELLPTIDRPLRVLGSGGVLDDVGLFEVKRFLYYAVQITRGAAGPVDLVPQTWAELLTELMSAIHPEKPPSPRFRLAASLDERLGAARKALKQARKHAQQVRTDLEAAVVADHGGAFDVRGRYARDVDDPRLRRASDGKFDLVDSELDAANVAVDDAQELVQAVESDVRARLTRELVGHIDLLTEVREALAQLDLLCALSDLRASWNGSWPTWGSTHEIRDGLHPRLLELEDEGQRISIELGAAPAIVTGPNMGGKSMLLKLVGLCQWCAQHGYPVPAQAVDFAPVDALVYVGADAADDGPEGLSSFGREVRRVVEHTREDACTLWLLDELARGTHPEEGAQIALEFVRARAAAGDRVMAATHFPSLAHWEGAEHFQIAGLTNPEALAALRQVSELDEIEAALRAAMDYTPIARRPEDATVPRDARRVAQALGLTLATTDPEST